MKFDKIKIEKGSGIEIYSCDRFYDLNKLSSSTISQIYLALSLSFSEMFSKIKMYHFCWMIHLHNMMTVKEKSTTSFGRRKFQTDYIFY